jgi:hypothetical protein
LIQLNSFFIVHFLVQDWAGDVIENLSQQPCSLA